MTAATVPDLLLKIVAQRRERLKSGAEPLEPTAERSYGSERPIATRHQSQRLGASSLAAASAPRGAGADAILLIAALYSAEELASWADEARALGLVPLIETHSEDDLARLAGRPWGLVGGNNRNRR